MRGWKYAYWKYSNQYQVYFLFLYEREIANNWKYYFQSFENNRTRLESRAYFPDGFDFLESTKNPLKVAISPCDW